jgi:hypothetical protein
METILPFIITQSRGKEVAHCHTAEQSSLSNYTDRSDINGHIGAAAYCPSSSSTTKLCLGRQATHNVFAAELVAINLVINMMEAQIRYCIILG